MTRPFSLSCTHPFSLKRTAAVLLTAVLSFPNWGHAETLRDLISLQIVPNVPFAQQLKTANGLGIKRVRFAVRWFEVERNHRFNWKVTDSQFALMRQLGMAPIITLFGGNDDYQARTSPDERPAPSTAAAVEGFAAFSSAVVKRYGADVDGKPIFYEIWNEPNTKTFWRPMPNPEDYGRLAAASCKAAKEANANAKVVGLAMEGTPVKAPYFVKNYSIDIYQQWAGRAATRPLVDCIDGISMHPYRKDPATYLTDEVDLQNYLKKIWSKDGPPLVINSEWGYQSLGDGGEMGQAVSDLTAILISASFNRILNLYQATDNEDNPTRPDHSYGLSTRSGTLKPAGVALKTLLTLVGDYEVGKLLSPSSDLYVLELSRPQHSGQRAWILWSTKPGHAPIPGAIRKVGQWSVDLAAGTQQPVPANLDSFGPSPLLVLETKPN